MSGIKQFLISRKSIRNFDKQFTITNEEINTILTEASSAPSSNNLQPWKVITVKDKSLQKKLSTLAFDQSAIKEASAVFILYADTTQYDHIEEITKRMVDQHIIDEDMATKQIKTVEAFFTLHPNDNQEFGAALDSGLFAMHLMHIIRAHGYGTVPIRGATFSKISELLDVPSHWIPIMLLPIGKALDNGYDSIRYHVNEFSTIIE
ncbi:nitroreductase family protein [Enterococcus termitis]|uniref:Nitroreductase domain-containing protein n=1 Tax=Enterococcus termitis TaxID=332950 RepID=A0A1E5GW69_9ENTE|nr:nitroreductase family protein [Enterococcus termitis]OEG16912.1 hypothetical protein BCR25_04760 [Enterococcus termitis]OJG99631.1 nitroreductase [Enterococcus termitis]